MASKSRLLARNAASRDSVESREAELRKLPYLMKKTPKEKSRLNTKNPRKTHPKVEEAKECTDTTGPPRLMKMPNSASVNATVHQYNVPYSEQASTLLHHD